MTTPLLDGLKVLDLGVLAAGPYCAKLMADAGADVVRVENYLRPDLSRNVVYPEGGPDDQYWEQGGTYHEQHRNKGACIGLDASRPEGRAAFLQLCTVSDVVLDSHPPGVLDRLGLGYDALREARPDIILVTTAGYGHGGPYSTNRSFGMMTELMCGLSALNGYPGEPSRRGTVPFTDHETVYHIATLVLAALERRDQTGEGAWIDVSQYEVGINMLGDAYVGRALGADLQQQGNADLPHPFAGCYRCRGEDAWITLSVTYREAWEALLSAIGRPDLAVRHDPWQKPLSAAERVDVDRAIAAWAEVRGPGECLIELQQRGVAAGMVTDVRDLLLDPHLAERGFFWLVDHHPEQGAGRRAWPGSSAQLSATPATLLRPAPMLGEHNQSVLCNLLGYSDEAYRLAEATKVIGTTPLAAATRPAARPVTARLHASPWAMGRIKCYDPDAVTRLRSRFGASYGAQQAMT